MSRECDASNQSRSELEQLAEATRQQSTVIGLDKSSLRSLVRAALARVPDAQRASDSSRIRSRILDAPWWTQARTVMLYSPLADEPDISPLISLALASAKRVCMPRVVDWGGRVIDCAWISDPARDLIQTRHAIHQPRDDAAAAHPNEVQVSLIPGLAFDRAGGRLGRGGGFYDRLLSRRAESADPREHDWFGLLVGVCLHEQVVEHVPVGAGDVRVQRLITPTEECVINP